jgi:hypothetical protein
MIQRGVECVGSKKKTFYTGSCHESVLMHPLVWVRSSTGVKAPGSSKHKPCYLLVLSRHDHQLFYFNFGVPLSSPSTLMLGRNTHISHGRAFLHCSPPHLVWQWFHGMPTRAASPSAPSGKTHPRPMRYNFLGFSGLGFFSEISTNWYVGAVLGVWKLSLNILSKSKRKIY